MKHDALLANLLPSLNKETLCALTSEDAQHVQGGMAGQHITLTDNCNGCTTREYYCR